ncbi:MAG: hypothetical protein WKG07_03920 [Hymenobacter sp.]
MPSWQSCTCSGSTGPATVRTVNDAAEPAARSRLHHHPENHAADAGKGPGAAR